MAAAGDARAAIWPWRPDAVMGVAALAARTRPGGQWLLSGTAAGNSRTLPLERVPAAVLRTAVKAARLIGNGLYGVDLKQTHRGVCVIEINDNPNLDAGVEDEILKEQLYEELMAEFLRRLEQRTRLRYGA